jgi:hypothetical protein
VNNVVKAMFHITFAVCADPSLPHDLSQLIVDVVALVVAIIAIMLAELVVQAEKETQPGLRSVHSCVFQVVPPAWAHGAPPHCLAPAI